MRAGERNTGVVPRGNRAPGFTLLELLVSLSILAAIAAFIAVAFRLSGTAVERGEAEASRMARLRAAIGIVERVVRSADPTPLSGETKPRPYFRGERNRLRFLSAASPSAAAGNGFRLLCLLETEGAAGGGLAIAEGSPFREGGTRAWEGRDNARVFFPGAAGLSFSYSPGPSKDGAWEWEDSWDPEEKNRLPAAVRVEFTAPREGEGREKTAFVVPIPAGG